MFRDVWRSLFGTGVFNSDGAFTNPPLQLALNAFHRGNVEVSWVGLCVAHDLIEEPHSRFHRSITRPFFSRDRISDFDIFDRHADLVITKLRERFNQGISVNIQDLLSRYTMDTATEFLFGKDVKSLSGQLPYPSTYKGYSPPRNHPSDRFTSAFNLAQEYSYPRGFFAGAWRLLEFWEDKVMTQRGITNEFIDPLVYAALQRKGGAKEEREVDVNNETLLDHLVKQTDGA